MQHIAPATNRIANATTKFFEQRENKYGNIQTGTGNNAPKTIVPKPSGNENKFPCMYKSCERKGKKILRILKNISYIDTGYFTRLA